MTEIKSTEQQLEEALERIEYMEDALKMIADVARDAFSCPDGKYIERLARNAYIGTPPALMRK